MLTRPITVIDSDSKPFVVRTKKGDTMRAVILGTLFLTLVGCTHLQLRNNTFHQAQCAHDLQQQQVLDNLAMFVVDPNSVPFFTIVGSGTSSVTDSGSASTSLSWLRTGFQSVGLNLGGGRVMQESFNIGPLTDPDKLARMRCAYQQAVGYHNSSCIDCCGLQKEWGNRKWDGRPASDTCVDECTPAPGWFCVGCKKDVPKNACYVGHYGKTYIWVPPGGSDELALLTLTILDYATAVPGQPKTKTVTTTTKYPSQNGIERIVEETEVVLAQATSKPALMQAAPSDQLPPPMDGMPSPTTPSPARQDFYFSPAPQVPSVVIPVTPF